MKVLGSIISLVLVLALASCGDDDCMQSDWVGTYTLSETECSDTTLEFTPTIIVSAVGEDSLSFSGLTTAIDNCNVTFSSGLGSARLNGSELELTQDDCTGTYTK